MALSRSKKVQQQLLDILMVGDMARQLSIIEAMGISKNSAFIEPIVAYLPKKQYRKQVVQSLKNYGVEVMPKLVDLTKERSVPIEICRFIPKVLEAFGNQEAVDHLFQLFSDVDLSVRLQTVRSLSNLRAKKPDLRFDRFTVINKIFEECKLYHQTLTAMHTQIIISYRNQKKSRLEVLQEERDARSSLLDLLERRLDAGLERIFKLLGLRYPQDDVLLAYDRLISSEEEERSRAIDFLDNLLTGNLKQRLFPIIEEPAIDFSLDENIQQIKIKVPTEQKCFELLLEIPDLKLRLAVLYLIGKQGDEKHLPLLEKVALDKDPKLKTFAQNALQQITQVSSP